jgi:hypothetical protein
MDSKQTAILDRLVADGFFTSYEVIEVDDDELTADEALEAYHAEQL